MAKRISLALVLAALLAPCGLPGAADPLAVEAPSRIRQGEPLLVWASEGAAPEAPQGGLGGLGLDRGLLRLRGRALLIGPDGAARASGPLFAAGPGRYGSLLPLDFGAAAGPCALALRDSLGLELSLPLPLSVEERAFASEDLRLDEENTAIRSEPDPRKTAEALALYAILDSSDPSALYLDGPFLPPTSAAPRSAGFGDKRRYLYANGGGDASVHAGVDIAVPVGTSVRAAGRGKVVFAAMRIVTGNTVIVEHLPGLYSIYMHLSKLRVKAGDLVERGALLGLSGKTGLATGPHLHWELRACGAPVDPDYWLDPGRWNPSPRPEGLAESPQGR